MKCHQCGAEVPSDAKVCSCGADLTGGGLPLSAGFGFDDFGADSQPAPPKSPPPSDEGNLPFAAGFGIDDGSPPPPSTPPASDGDLAGFGVDGIGAGSSPPPPSGGESFSAGFGVGESRPSPPSAPSPPSGGAEDDLRMFMAVAGTGLSESKDLAQELAGKPAEEVRFTIDLDEIGPNKRAIIRLMVELGEDEDEATTKLSRLPTTVATAPTLIKANQLKQQFRQLGAKLRVTPIADSDSTLYHVDIQEVGPRRIQLIALIREMTGAGMAQANQLLSQLPATLLSGLPHSRAKEIAQKLEDLGAKVAIVDD